MYGMIDETGKYIKKVKNFMDGNSYTSNPLTTLKIVAASSIFGEPQYYVGNNKTRIKNLIAFLANPSLMFINDSGLDSVEDVMESAIDAALEYDFAATIEFAKRLRNEFNMRLNPQVIFIRAAMHPKRAEFNRLYPNVMREVGREIINRPDDMTNQLNYYISVNGSKNHLPGLVKRVWTDKLAGLSDYQIAKYKAKSLIDVTRLANTRKVRLVNSSMNTLMETGTFEVSEENQTWEKYISENGSNKESWEWVIDNIFAVEKE